MATKSYSKHKEFKEFSTKSTVPYSDEQFETIKSELLPKHSRLGSLGRAGGAGSDNEYHYEYHEDRHPSGKYERKDLHTVEQYTVPAKPSSEHSSYYYTREDTSLPAITSSYHVENSTSSTPGYSKIRSKTTKDLAQNVDELDSLLDDLQKDQERQLYKGGYTSDTAESSSFDYRKTSTPVKITTAPSSGYSTLKTSERVENQQWTSSPLPPPPTITRESELTRELYREEKTEQRVIPSQISPALPKPVPAVICHQCDHRSGTLTRSNTPMNKVTTTVKTYTYELPADQDPTSVPIPISGEQTLSEQRYLHTDTTTRSAVPPSPSLGCQYCTHCNSRITTKEYNTLNTTHHHASPAPPPATTISTTEHRYESTTTDGHPTSERIVYPTPANEVRTPVNLSDAPHNGHGPYGPTTYKWSETSYSAFDRTERHPVNGSPAPFPRPVTPSPGTQQPPKQLDQLLADFPEAKFPTQPDGVRGRNVEITSSKKHDVEVLQTKSSAGNSKNVAGPAVYYPPGHEPFAKKEAASYQAASAGGGGGGYAAGRGMYEYEAGSKSKEKRTEGKAVVPVCLPLCCAMPCTIM